MHQVFDAKQFLPQTPRRMQCRKIIVTKISQFQQRDREGISSRFSASRSRMISSVSPPYETASIASPRASIPKSPCSASAGCRKKDGVPVLDNVEEIFRAINPDLPIPLTTTRPLHANNTSTAFSKDA